MNYNFIKTGILNPKELEKIVNETHNYNSKLIDSGVIRKDGKKADDQSVRISKTFFPGIKQAPKTYNIIQSLLIEKYADSKLDLSTMVEIQYVEYPLGGRFDWHSDIIYRYDSEKKIRGLTLSLNLTQGSDYEGGELHIKITNDQVIKLDRRYGSYIIFPAFLKHKVTPITSGSRNAMISWLKLTEKEIENMKTRYNDYIRNNVLQ
jgi:PKHD-type hydroxylase